MTRLLFVASEVYPLVKTGGLADVAGSLPEALRQCGADVRLLLPGYGDVLAGLEPLPVVATLEVAGETVQLLETRLPDAELPVWLVAHPLFGERSGNPYHDEDGQPWPDNAERFLLLSRTAAALSLGQAGIDWQPQVLHCNDWHTGPAIALVHQCAQRPRTVFTIHNLAHMGLFDKATFQRLGLPEDLWWSLEYYDQLSFIKGGLVFADVITTVSPGYAREICEAPGGMGLEGLLSSRREHLVGILNGIDNSVWDPATDPCLAQHYGLDSLADKLVNKRALQRETGLEQRDDLPLIGFVGRLAEQKGLALMLPIMAAMLDIPAQFVLLGTGDRDYEESLAALAADHPGAMAVLLAYDEGLAHRIEAGADLFLMPSLFEPCGLNQLYSLRYGTLPLVREVGGLADTVVDSNADTLAAGTATGFVFGEPSAEALLEALQRAAAMWRDRDSWGRIQANAMQQDFSWRRSALRYLELYRD